MHDTMCVGNKIYKQGDRSYVIKYRNADSIDFMRSIGLIERKSLKMDYPNIPVEYFGDFVRGYFDGNGSIILRKTRYNTYAQVSFACGSEKFIYGLQKALLSAGINSYIYRDGRENNASLYLRVTKRKDIEALYRLMYVDLPEKQFLKRKKDKYDVYLDCKPKYKVA